MRMTKRGERDVAAIWNGEYAAGRYRDEPALPFVDDIVTVAREHELLGREGLYIGCGNGRNYLALVSAGLDLIGVDVSECALEQLAERAPARKSRLVHGDVGALPEDAAYPLIIGIQVFQHGDRATAHEHIRLAQARLLPGGLFCLRVNAVGTEVEYEHDVIERDADGGFTVSYGAGPKAGLDVRFFTAAELNGLFVDYERILPPRLMQTWRTPRTRGQWSQWEAIWQRQ
jgi:hypothetical protein